MSIKSEMVKNELGDQIAHRTSSDIAWSLNSMIKDEGENFSYKAVIEVDNYRYKLQSKSKNTLIYKCEDAIAWKCEGVYIVNSGNGKGKVHK